MKQNPCLRILDLNDNTLTKVGGIVLGAALQTSMALQHLNLGDCLLRSNGWVPVVAALLAAAPNLKVSIAPNIERCK